MKDKSIPDMMPCGTSSVSLMQSGNADGMHTLNMDLIHLVQQGYISQDMAESYTNSKKELSQYF